MLSKLNHHDGDSTLTNLTACCTSTKAYFLAKRDVPVILVDPVGIAPAASAKAGGLLARDWRDGTALEELQQKGFDLHQELADELGSETIQYRRLTCAAVAVDEDRAVQKPPSRKLKDVEWVPGAALGLFGPTRHGTNVLFLPFASLCEMVGNV